MRENPKQTKYVVDEGKRKRFPAPLFRTVVRHEVDAAEVEKYRKQHGRLPAHVHVVKEGQDERRS